jgi:activator of HSP90 ATPase
VSKSIRVSTTLPVSTKKLYLAWLNSKEHSAFTGAKAVIEPRLGGSFSAWDGYIRGTTLELEPYRRILQSWRSSDFPEGSKDSKLEVLFEEVGKGARITLLQSDVPEGQEQQLKQGWLDFYFKPMREYFGRADKKKPARKKN